MADRGRALKGGKRKFSISGQFSWRLIEMQRSPAYRVLSLSAHRVLARLEIELAQHGGDENGKLPCTFDDFEAYGISRRLVAPAIREVVGLGFVDITERGRAGNAEWRRPNVYRLTYRPTKLTEPTNDWRKIETVEEAEEIASKARDAKPEKTKSQYHKKPQGLGLKVNRSRPVHRAKSDTTGHGSLSDPLSISREHSANGSSTPSAMPTKGQARDGVPAPTLEQIGQPSAALLRSLKKNRRPVPKISARAAR